MRVSMKIAVLFLMIVVSLGAAAEPIVGGYVAWWRFDRLLPGGLFPDTSEGGRHLVGAGGPSYTTGIDLANGQLRLG